jgi:hypothetical protein
MFAASAIFPQEIRLRHPFAMPEQEVIGCNHSIGCFCVNTGKTPLERISMRPSGLSLVLPQNPADIIASIQIHPALALTGRSDIDHLVKKDPAKRRDLGNNDPDNSGLEAGRWQQGRPRQYN